MKKKILAVLLIVAIAACLTACGKGEILGTWTQTGMKYNNETFDLSEKTYKDIVTVLTVKEDGTYALSSADTDYDGQWDKDGDEYTFDQLKATIKDGKLSLTVGENCIYYFEKDE